MKLINLNESNKLYKVPSDDDYYRYVKGKKLTNGEGPFWDIVWWQGDEGFDSVYVYGVDGMNYITLRNFEGNFVPSPEDFYETSSEDPEEIIDLANDLIKDLEWARKLDAPSYEWFTDYLSEVRKPAFKK